MQTRARTYFFWLAGGAAAAAFLFVFIFPFTTDAQETPEERRVRLEQQLAEIEKDIVEKRGVLSEKQRERTSLERDIAILDSQIAVAQQQIKHRDITIVKLRDDIGEKQSAIGQVDNKVVRSAQSLAQLIRRTREIDDTSLAEIVLSGTITDFFEDIDMFEVLQRDLSASFDQMALLRADLAARKSALEGKQSEEEDLRRIQVLEKQAIERKESEKQEILQVTKGQEQAYQTLIAERERTAAQIRSALFNLRDTGAIPFGDAYEFAKQASAKTGVRPALILAILRQETNLGENVGQCLLTNSPSKGDGKGRNTGTPFSGVMKPTRDVDPFLAITAELGIDPYSQVVSCPPSYGYGGAMGPAQFIPSTWILYKDRLATITGDSPPNPWSPRTAIFATALLMADNGADGGGYSTERLAALRYFAGWANATKPAYAFYGDDVMDFATQYQSDVDILEGR
ncbi:hypothetical protein COU18_02335 [Candidatus Kaiserbacteria bacterium CG10_big_fil_rev_8_21_14_0_10_51_14]|uniref:Uncharacterized protein n=1 Tax=Candidatus Kaiserbacteria bacterium CG10_big_fil_rev_8_21_14_0_10_51_14 TaxID=1974610 RepID=A0A2H0UBS9_9BACT|nr:MAG: hypothetical protein COU18_02335 [Candidatus Kaiserbacteria bacterium CG10_big_fil_rev_8_21_14_0_10_51_14]